MSQHDDILAAANADAEEEYSGLEDIESATIGAPLEPGWYLMRIIESKLGRTKPTAENANQPKFGVSLVLADGSSNKRVFKHLVLTGKSAKFTRGFFESFGVDVTKPLRPSDHLDRVACVLLKKSATDNDVVTTAKCEDGETCPE